MKNFYNKNNKRFTKPYFGYKKTFDVPDPVYNNAAFDYYTKKIEEFPKEAWAYAKRGDISLAKGDFEAAYDDYTRALEIFPDSAVLYKKKEES